MPLLTLLGQAASNVTLGGTSQIGAITSSGGIQIADNIGGTNQIGAITSSGVLSVGLTIGATSQIEAITSSGVINAETDQPTGGYSRLWRQFDEYERKKREYWARRKKKKEKAEKIEDELERKLALAEREIEEEEARWQQLEAVTQLVQEQEAFLKTLESDRLQKAVKAAVDKQTFSVMERLERELKRFREEEDFLIEASKYYFINDSRSIH